MKTNKRGISLIVLAIVIIVTIILSGAIILNISNNGLIENTSVAVLESDLVNLKENVDAKFVKKRKTEFDSNTDYKLSDVGIKYSKYEDYLVIKDRELRIKNDAPENMLTAADNVGIIRTGAITADGTSLTAKGVPQVSLLDYIIEGKSEQNKISLESMFTSGGLDNTTGKTFEEQAQVSTTKTRIRMVEPIKLEKNKDYTIKSSLTNTIGFRLYDENGLCTTALSVSMASGEYKFNSGDNTSMAFNVVDCTDINAKYEIYGVTPSPDNPVEVESLGDLVTEGKYSGKYKVPIKVCYKNLFNINEIKQVSGRKSNFELKGGVTYTISFKFIEPASQDIMIGTMEKLNILLLKTTTELGDYSVSITPTNDTYLAISVGGTPIEIQFSEVFTKNTTDFQIEYGNEKTPYEQYKEKIYNIYLNEPLRSVGSYRDYIDFKNQQVVRKVVRYDFTGEENWSEDANETTAVVTTGYVGKKLGTQELSNRFKVLDTGTELCIGLANATSDRVSISQYKTIPGVTDITTLKTWLQNNKTYFIYVLATEEYEKIKLPKIELQSSSINVSVVDDKGIGASKITIEY